MHPQHSIFLKKAPFLRIVIALITGIILQWHTQLGCKFWIVTGIAALFLLTWFSFIPVFDRFRLGFINGIAFTLVFISLGGFLTEKEDIRNHRQWIGNYDKNVTGYIVVLDEPVQEKPKTYKALALVKEIVLDGKTNPAYGKIIIYFKKDSLLPPGFGSSILFQKSPEEIKSAGNPGGFDYKTYGILHGFTHQVFLQAGEYEILPSVGNKFRQFIYNCREWLLEVLRKNISGEKELGLSEALLIGYKDDLDKSLVQSYSNTGVVHIIAISGLHLGLIYLLLSLLTRPLKKNRKLQWLSFLLIISGLWLFTLLAGAQPSILRSAIMFTCIAAGELLYKKSSIYNSLALSAFIMLCINPFWLWDLGFQLSYCAVLSIIIFQRPIYNLFFIRNKFLDQVWKLNAVTLAAQILTIPLTVYYFHQFPNFFLVTNFIAVPLSSLILLGEIGLCSISFFPLPAEWMGKIIAGLIRFMNNFIERVDTIACSTWQGLQINGIQVLLMYLMIVLFTTWLSKQWRNGLISGLIVFLVFIIIRATSFLDAMRQQKILVYNVPRKQAIDLIHGRDYFYTGDSLLNADPYSRHFYLDPSRTLLRTRPGRLSKELLFSNGCVYWNEILIVSDKAKFSFYNWPAGLMPRKIIFDSSVPSWKSASWKKQLDSLGISYHDVSIEGAYLADIY